MIKLRNAVSVGLAATSLAIVLAYVLGGQVLLQSPYAEPGHNLIMSLLSGLQIYDPQTRDGSEPQMHGIRDPASESPTYGVIGNNMLGGQATLPAGGLAAVVITGAILLSVAAFVISWKQRSFVVAGLLGASGIILMILPLANMNFVFPGPIIGVIVGLVILGLGVTKGIKSARAVMVAPK